MTTLDERDGEDTVLISIHFISLYGSHIAFGICQTVFSLPPIRKLPE